MARVRGFVGVAACLTRANPPPPRYCAQFLQAAFGGAAGPAPTVAGATASLDPTTGHDVHVAAQIKFGDAGFGSLECSLRHVSPRAASINGTKGVIRVPYPFWCPTRLTVQTMTGPGSQQWSDEAVHDFPLPPDVGPPPGGYPFVFVNSQGLAYEALEVERCLREGLTESPQFGVEENGRVMGTISDLRATWAKGS